MTGQGRLSAGRLGRLAGVMRDWIERGEIPGAVALVSRGEAVHVEAAGAQELGTGVSMRRDTIFRIASMTKPMAAAAAMILVEEAMLRLDDPVDRWLPELADRRVLRAIDAGLDDTESAERAITLRDLLTFRLGLGAIMVPPERYPIQQAMAQAGLAPSPDPLPFPADEFMARVGRLPLMHQPGTRWMYHTGSDILGVLIARASGMPLERFLQERIFAPLGMKDTGFSVPDKKRDRFAASYRTDPEGKGLVLHDRARDGQWSRPPVFASAGGGLVSTANDCLAFGRMMLGGGQLGGARILSRTAVTLMTADHITPEQKAASPFFPGFWDRSGWGFGVSITTRRDRIGPSVGSFGWMGGLGTSWSCDPREDTVCILLTQRMMTGPSDATLHGDFQTLAYAAIED